MTKEEKELRACYHWTEWERKAKELEKENEELKEEMKAKQVVLNDFKSRVETVTDRFNKKSSQLTKATEIIKKFSEFANNEIEYDPEYPQEHTDLWNKLCEQAKQFLKDENIILEDAQAGNSPFDADEVFDKEMKAYPEEVEKDSK